MSRKFLFSFFTLFFSVMLAVSPITAVDNNRKDDRYAHSSSPSISTVCKWSLGGLVVVGICALGFCCYKSAKPKQKSSENVLPGDSRDSKGKDNRIVGGVNVRTFSHLKRPGGSWGEQVTASQGQKFYS